MKHTKKTDLLIIGAGPAGLTAADEAASKGAAIKVVDEAPTPGGRLPSQIHPAPKQKNAWTNGPKTARDLTSAAEAQGAEIINGQSIWGLWNKKGTWYAALAPAAPNNKIDFMGIEAKAVLMATGAAQNPMVFPGWNLPGVITAGAAQTMINVHRILPGRKAVVVGADPLALSAAQLMIAVGMEVKGIVMPPNNGLNLAPASPSEALKTLGRASAYAPGSLLPFLGRLAGQWSDLFAGLFPINGLSLAGLPLKIRKAAVTAEGADRVSKLRIRPVKADGKYGGGREEAWPVDVVVTSAGLYPLVEIAVAAGCPAVRVPQLGGWIPVHGPGLETHCPGLFVAGSITGIEGSEVARAQGRLAGASASGYLGLSSDKELREKTAFCNTEINRARIVSLPFMPDIIKGREIMNRHWNQTRKNQA